MLTFLLFAVGQHCTGRPYGLQCHHSTTEIMQYVTLVRGSKNITPMNYSIYFVGIIFL